MKPPTLWEARRDAGLSQAELAKKLGWATSSVSRRETGRSTTLPSEKEELCRLLNVPDISGLKEVT